MIRFERLHVNSYFLWFWHLCGMEPRGGERRINVLQQKRSTEFYFMI